MMSAKVLEVASQAGLWYNEGTKIVALGSAANTPSRIHLIGDVPMDTVPHHILNGNLKFFYVYTLAYPDGTVFYVGKGSGNRIHAHEKLAKRTGLYFEKTRKAQTIREIWARGEEVVKQVMFVSSCETDALIYEWALINLIYDPEQLSNMINNRFALWREYDVAHRSFLKTLQGKA